MPNLPTGREFASQVFLEYGVTRARRVGSPIQVVPIDTQLDGDIRGRSPNINLRRRLPVQILPGIRESRWREPSKTSEIRFSPATSLKPSRSGHHRRPGGPRVTNEAISKVLAHYLCCLIQTHYELGIVPMFWGEQVSEPSAVFQTVEIDPIEALAWI